MKKQKTIMFGIALLVSFSTISTFAESKQTPKLVVGIVIDQMRYDYIYKFWDSFGDEGFRRLVNEGFFCRNTDRKSVV